MNQIAFTMEPGEFWWGGVVNCGYQMPFDEKSCCVVDTCMPEALDQAAPLFLSSKGRYVWSEGSFSFKADGGCVHCEGTEPIQLEAGYETLRGAYLAACKKRLPFPCSLPDARFFNCCQYNTWIELKTDQTAQGILRYARGILSHGLQPGILMIDEGWQEEYGVFEFNRRKIPNPKALVQKLHEMGFAVMLWVTPLVSAAGPRFLEMKKVGYLLRGKSGEIAIREWWNGYSAVLDLSNEAAYGWMKGQLQELMKEYGIDGFKFDAGDPYFYRDDDQTAQPTCAREQTRIYNQLGEAFGLNEFRAAWKYGGHSVVARLQDKLHAWDTRGLASLIPHTVLQGLLGYAFCCPDMVGGGDVSSFGAGEAMDEELFIRWAQASACMGMIQMSIAPWRVLSKKNADAVSQALRFHASLGERICALAKNAAKTGEPIVRHMAYVFPEEGFERVDDCFMLGEDLLVCPVLKKGEKKKSIRLPQGKWKTWRGETVPGGQAIECEVIPEDIPLFYRL